MDQIKLRLGQAVGLKELIATLVVAGLLLIVGTVVFAKVKAAMATNDSPSMCYQQTNNTACFESYNESTDENLTISGDAGTSVANVESTTYNAFQLATVALIVLAAAVIIGILIPNRSTKILHWQIKGIWRIKTLNLYSDYQHCLGVGE